MRQERHSSTLPGTEKGGTTFPLQRSPSLPKIGRTYEGVPTKEKTQDQPKTGKGLRIALAGLTTLGAVETTGAIIQEQVNHEPLSPQTIKADLMWPWNLGKSAVEDIAGVFRGKTLEEKFPTVLPKESFTPVTKEEEQQLWKDTKTLDLENHTLTTGFPFDQTTIDRNPNMRMSQEFNAILPAYIDGEKLKQEGVKNVTSVSGLSKGDKHRLIYDADKYDASIITIAIAGVREGEGPGSYIPAYTSFKIIYRDKETGKSDVWQSISGLYAKTLVEDGVSAATGSPILELTTDLQDWDGKTGQVLPGEKGQFTIRSGYMQENPRAPIPLTQDFPRTADGNIAVQQQ